MINRVKGHRGAKPQTLDWKLCEPLGGFVMKENETGSLGETDWAKSANYWAKNSDTVQSESESPAPGRKMLLISSYEVSWRD